MELRNPFRESPTDETASFEELYRKAATVPVVRAALVAQYRHNLSKEQMLLRLSLALIGLNEELAGTLEDQLKRQYP